MGEKSRRGRTPGVRFSVSGLVLLAAVVLCVGLAGCGGVASGGLPYVEHFSGGCDRWSTQDDGLLKAGCVDGEYQVLTREARNVQFFTVPIDADSVKVEVDARIATGSGPLKYGIACFRADHSGDWFVVTPGRGYQIVWYDEYGLNHIAHARPGTEQKQVILTHVTHHIGALCTSGRAGSAGGSGIIAMSVDGKLILNSVDPAAITARALGAVGKIEHVGVIVFPSAVKSDIRFDNFAVTSVSTPTSTTTTTTGAKPTAPPVAATLVSLSRRHSSAGSRRSLRAVAAAATH